MDFDSRFYPYCLFIKYDTMYTKESKPSKDLYYFVEYHMEINKLSTNRISVNKCLYCDVPWQTDPFGDNSIQHLRVKIVFQFSRLRKQRFSHNNSFRNK